MATRHVLHALTGLLVLVSGCRTPQQARDPEFAQVAHSMDWANCDPDPVGAAMAPTFADLEGPHAVADYVCIALSQNPDIQAARKRVEAFAYQVPVAASLPDPMMNVTVQPEPVQTAAGRQELIVAGSQKLHWFGKRGTRACIAESRTDMARAQLAAAELTTIERVKRAYYELHFIQQAIAVTEAEQQLLAEIREVADTRYRTNRASQQDVLRAELELSNVQNERIRLGQQLSSGQARLARLLHVSPQTQLLALDQLPPEDVPGDLDALQRQAVAARPELHAQLAAIRRDRQAVDLARLDYKPDMTLGFSWIEVADNGISPVANGRDSLLLTAGVNLPVYRKRLTSSVLSAEAKAVSTAREYDSLRDGTLEEVTDLFAKAHSQRDLLVLFHEDILPKARQTLEVSRHAYRVGEVDFLQLIDNWRQLLRYEISCRRTEASLRQTLAGLERAVGGCYGCCNPPPLPYTHYPSCVDQMCAEPGTIPRPGFAPSEATR